MNRVTGETHTQHHPRANSGRVSCCIPRVSIRSALVAVALLGVWLGLMNSRAHRQRVAVDSIRKAGGQAYYTFEFDGERFTNAPPPGPSWLTNLLGIDWFATIGMVSLDTETDADKRAIADATPRLADLPDVQFAYLEGVTDATLSHLNCAAHLRTLSITSASVSDDGWEPIESFSNLEKLTLAYVEPAGDEAVLSRLKRLTRLKMLELDGIQLTDSGVKCLQGLFQLEDLTIRDSIRIRPHEKSRITEAGWATLRHFDRLQHLCLEGQDVTDAVLRQINHMPNLTDLDLQDCSVTDGGLSELAKLESLENLVLRGDGISDDGLQRLRNLPHLKYLCVGGSQITADGIYQLRVRMPGLQTGGPQ